MIIDSQPPNQSPEPMPFGAGRSAVAVGVASRRRPSFLCLGHLSHQTKIMKTLFISVGLATSCLLSGCAHYRSAAPRAGQAASATTAGTVTNIYTFPVTSTGMAPLSYQWYFVNTNIQAETNNTVTITGTVKNTGTPPSSNPNGNWYLVVTNDSGMAATNTNGNWYLVITNGCGIAATNSTVPGYDVSPGYARGKRPLQKHPKDFEVTNTGTPPMVYQWQPNAANFGFDADTPPTSSDLFVGPGYSIQLPESCPDMNYWPQTTVPNERTDYSIMILKPSPDANYCLQIKIIEPNEGTNYALQILHE